MISRLSVRSIPSFLLLAFVFLFFLCVATGIQSVVCLRRSVSGEIDPVLHAVLAHALVVLAWLLPFGWTALSLALGWRGIRRKWLAVASGLLQLGTVLLLSLLCSFTGFLCPVGARAYPAPGIPPDQALLRFCVVHWILCPGLLLGALGASWWWCRRMRRAM